LTYTLLIYPQSEWRMVVLNRWPLSVDEMAQNSDHLRKLLRGELLEVGIAVFVIAILFGLTVSVGLFIIHYM